jgi:putative hydrolase of the HAD superfamily
MLKAITLDFWGTLVNDRHSAAPMRVAALAERLPGLAPERIQAAYDASWRRFLSGMAQGWGLPPAALLSDTLDALGIALRPEIWARVLRRWETEHMASPPPLVPKAVETLRALRARGLAIGLISDTGATPGRVLRQFMAQVGLRPLFDWLTFSNETGVSKARPQAFLLTLRALGAAPGEALHVGDTPTADVDGAHAVGMAAALTIEVRDKRRGGERPDLVLERLADLPEALALLRAA